MYRILFFLQILYHSTRKKWHIPKIIVNRKKKKNSIHHTNRTYSFQYYILYSYTILSD